MAGTTRPSLCPSCRHLVGVGATHCHTCGASLTFSPTALASSLRKLLPGEVPGTALFLMLNLVFFGITCMVGMAAGEGPQVLMMGSRIVWAVGGAEASAVLSGELWRLVVPMFLHGGLIHLAFNSIALGDLGPAVEHTYGTARFVFLYVVTGVIGFAVSVAWSVISGVPHLSIGGSGAVLGLVGVLLAITRRRGGIQMQMIRAQLVRSIVYTFLIGVVVHIDNAAHVGGLAAGFLLGSVMTDRPPVTDGDRKLAVALATGSGLLVVAAFAALGLRLIL